MKTDPNSKKPATGKERTEIETEGPLSEKDEVKKAEENMRQSQEKVKGKK